MADPSKNARSFTASRTPTAANRIFVGPALIAIGAPLLVAASVPTLDANKGVELVNAAPSDFRAILAVMFLLLFIQTMERWWAGFRANKTADKFAVAADKLSDAVGAMTAAQTQLALEVRDITRDRK